MAKKIKFPLKLKDDFPVRTIAELKEHFDLDRIVAYFLDGKLLTWLKDRYYDVEVDAICNLQKDDPNLQQKLSQIFGVEYSDYQLDINEVEERNRRLGILRQFTSDSTVLEQVASVAFNQEDLGDLIDDGVQKIFLCNNSFVIPLSIGYKTYIGIGKVIAIIRSNAEVDFKSKHIEFHNIDFDNDYLKSVTKETPPTMNDANQLLRLGHKFYESNDHEQALQYYRKAADLGNADAMKKIGDLIRRNDCSKAILWYKKAIDLGNTDAMVSLGGLCFWANDTYIPGIAPSQRISEAKKLFEKAASLGNTKAMIELGVTYQVPKDARGRERRASSGDLEKAREWYTKAAELGDIEAMEKLERLYRYYFKNSLEADKWYEKAAMLKL